MADGLVAWRWRGHPRGHGSTAERRVEWPRRREEQGERGEREGLGGLGEVLEKEGGLLREVGERLGERPLGDHREVERRPDRWAGDQVLYHY